MQGDPFLKIVFDKYAESSSGTVGGSTVQEHPRTDDGLDPEINSKFEKIVKTEGLQRALLELGAPMAKNKADELMLMMDLDENGGLDFEEFKRGVQQPPTQLEQWASMLPLAGMLARSLPVCCGQGDQPLRNFSRLGEDGIDTAVEVFSEGLRRLLMQAKDSTKQMFDTVDDKALEAAKDSADGVSAASKFKTFKMSTGKIEEYHEGLSSRIGEFIFPFSPSEALSALIGCYHPIAS